MARIGIKNKKRIIYSFGIIAALIVVLLFRMAWIQVVNADEYSEIAINQQTSDIPLEAKRGSIYDRNGQELASSATCYSVWVRTAQIKENYSSEKIKEIAKKLAVVLNKDEESVVKSLNSKQFLVKIAKYLDKDTLDKVKALKIIGLETSENTKRNYPLGDFASNLLGSVSDDNEGRTGIEQEFDSYLSGIAGRWIKNTDINGQGLSFGKETYYQAEDGLNVVLTIDEVLQHYAESAIATGMEKTKADKITCIVMDPKTGDILAMAQNPGFDPNDAMTPTSEEEAEALKKMTTAEQTTYLSKMWRNSMISDTYEPGSTFKLVTTSAALEEGIVTPDSKYECKGSYDVDGVVLHCWGNSVHGVQTITEAVGNSCNPVQIQLALKMGKETYYNYLEMFGFTERTQVDLPAEAASLIQNRNDIGNVELATMAYGQGIAVTPIELLTAICSIGNDGVLMKPRIVSKLTDSDGKTVKEYKAKQVRKVLSSKTAKEMCAIMEYEVSEGGGGTAKIAGYRIGGKTGTANKAENGKYSTDTYSSFVSMVPMDDPKLAVLVVVDSPQGVQFGSLTAAPIVKEFYKNALSYLEIEPQYTEEEEKAMNSGYVYVPDVTGKSFSDAAGILGKYGLTAEAVPASASSEDFEVKAQYPKAGKKASKNGKIYLYNE